MTDHTRYIVWNADRTEGFVTDSESDALAAAGNKQVQFESSLGADFRSAYEDQKRTVETIQCPPPLSKRAQALLVRVRQGHFYRADDTAPKAMQELIDHGLVGTMGRVVELQRCYVAAGHAPFVMDRAPDEGGDR